MTRRTTGLALAVLSFAAAAPAAAQIGEPPPVGDTGARERALEHFERASALMQNENWEVALVEFQRSLDLYPTRSALFNLAMCEKALHRYRAALGHFELWQERYAGVAPEDERELVARTIEELRQFVGFLVVSSDPPGASVRVDGEEVGTTPFSAPASLDAERHVVEVALDGHRPLRQEILVSPLETVTLDLTLEPLAETPPDVVAPEVPPPAGQTGEGLHPAWFWTTASAAVALGIGGAVAGAIAIDTRSELDDLATSCRGGDRSACDDGRARVDDLDVAETATNALLFSAAGIAVAAVVLVFFTEFGDGEEPPVSAVLAPSVGSDGAATGANLWLSVAF